MPLIHVAVGVIQDTEGRVLLTRRADSAHQGGLWEFPGGKVERGEDFARALRRELREELGIEVSTHQPMISVNHRYSDKKVWLEVHRILCYRGRPRGMEGQPLIWVPPAELHLHAMPAADRPICMAVKLPRRYLITGPDPAVSEQFLQRLEASLVRGIRLVQLRAPGLGRDEYTLLAADALRLCRKYGARLMLNCPIDWARELNADGIHLNSKQLAALSERPLKGDQWVSASCHNLGEIRQAMAINTDFCVFSPVLATASHPTAEPLGWRAFSQAVAAANIPVYALGGMGPTHIGRAVENGGQGIAAIRTLWGEA